MRFIFLESYNTRFILSLEQLLLIVYLFQDFLQLRNKFFDINTYDLPNEIKVNIVVAVNKTITCSDNILPNN